ncbi:MAG: hypothetical protein ACT4PU_10390 [Planctomycetota bacterium]
MLSLRTLRLAAGLVVGLLVGGAASCGTVSAPRLSAGLVSSPITPARTPPDWVRHPAAGWRPGLAPYSLFVHGRADFERSVSEAESLARAEARSGLALALTTALRPLFEAAAATLPEAERDAAAAALQGDVALRDSLVEAGLAGLRPLGTWFDESSFHVWVRLDAGQDFLPRLRQALASRWGAERAKAAEAALHEALRGYVAAHNGP